jgi:MFS family permease
MNAMALIYFLGFIASAVVGGLLGRHFGTLGGWIGAGVGLIFWAGFLWGISVLVEKLGKLYPGRPICSQGKCSAHDYHFRRLKNGGSELECSCGDRYFSKRNRFMKLDEKGITHPYMKRRHSFAKWEKDDSHAELI